jgi:hypothetical protein
MSKAIVISAEFAETEKLILQKDVVCEQTGPVSLTS